LLSTIPDAALSEDAVPLVENAVRRIPTYWALSAPRLAACRSRDDIRDNFRGPTASALIVGAARRRGASRAHVGGGGFARNGRRRAQALVWNRENGTMVAHERVDLTPLVTHRFALEDIEEAFEVFSHQRGGVLKVALQPRAVIDARRASAMEHSVQH
jgi:hypothetical protein